MNKNIPTEPNSEIMFNETFAYLKELFTQEQNNKLEIGLIDLTFQIIDRFKIKSSGKNLSEHGFFWSVESALNRLREGEGIDFELNDDCDESCKESFEREEVCKDICQVPCAGKCVEMIEELSDECQAFAEDHTELVIIPKKKLFNSINSDYPILEDNSYTTH